MSGFMFRSQIINHIILELMEDVILNIILYQNTYVPTLYITERSPA